LSQLKPKQSRLVEY